VSAIDGPQCVGEQDRIAGGIPLESHAQCSAVPSNPRPVRNNMICTRTDREQRFEVHMAMSWLNDVVLGIL
jgi:hypothetical protein